MITDRNTIVDYKNLLEAADQTDARLAGFIREVLPQNQFQQAIRAMKKYKPELFEKLKKCIHITKAPRRERIALIKGTPNLVRKELWEIVHDMYKTYSCETGFTTDKSVRKQVTIYIKGNRPKKRWPSDMLHLQDDVLKKIDRARIWTFSFDARIFTAELNQEEIDALRKDNNIESVMEEPEAHILWGEYAPYPAFNDAAENTDWGVTKLNVSYAWAKGFKGQGIKVGVIDTGIDMNHIDLIDAYKGGYNFIAGNDNPVDDHMHGTHCCGIVGARENSIGYTGVAPEADIYAIKCLNAKGSGSFSTIASGVDWCITNGMDIISLSLGGDMACSGVLADACNNAWNAGIVVVASAGNDGVLCSEEGCILSPANCSSVIAVGSIDKDEFRSGFSSFGPQMELIAPGEGITSTWLIDHDLYEDGLHIVGDSWYWANGTSMACPHIAGAAALIKCWYPAATNYEIREWLQDNAKDL